MTAGEIHRRHFERLRQSSAVIGIAWGKHGKKQQKAPSALLLTARTTKIKLRRVEESHFISK